MSHDVLARGHMSITVARRGSMAFVQKKTQRTDLVQDAASRQEMYGAMVLRKVNRASLGLCDKDVLEYSPHPAPYGILQLIALIHTPPPLTQDRAAELV